MSSVNMVILLGRLGKDPELRHTQSGTAMCNFSMATTEINKEKDGSKKEHTDWHKCVAFGRNAEIVNEYTKKGNRLYIMGRNQTRDWETKEGEKRQITEVIVRQVILIEKGTGEKREPENERPDGFDGPTPYVPF